jgi:transcriptional regulator with XRE-family HTH domain
MKYRRIRDLREDHDLTQTQMGEILSCSQRVYSNYERGELDIPTEILRKLALYYHVTTDYLLELSDERWPYANQNNQNNQTIDQTIN